ncbi:hypothetical protein F441_00058 [Phytophthora nicotianae CJ01A1]|uniref:Uncharacterized protein n=2 Tax=Phytophthora nicotianae TaxID=4792 RepID=W2M4K4_PHYNI|nr:hypothetical protein L915_00058 [Phytophthora nicotianae]ETM03781.1 hypothetical protein L917_00048 [Phytophthora nicotianae]ETP27440.1 hypothetical protein F441_00058 [Phytophthora nicotianae CJ01A1]
MAPIMDEPGDHLTAKIHLTVLLIGCASHRLNLAVRDFLRPYEAALSEVRQLMRKVRTLNQAAKLSGGGVSSSSDVVITTIMDVFEDHILKRRKVSAEPSVYKLLSAIPPA